MWLWLYTVGFFAPRASTTLACLRATRRRAIGAVQQHQPYSL